MRNTWAENQRRKQVRRVPTQRVWVTAYAISRVYGGPEEGGWWWDDKEPVETIFCRRGGADVAIATLQAAHASYLPGGSISSVMGGYEIDIRIETKYQQSATKNTPRWE